MMGALREAVRGIVPALVVTAVLIVAIDIKTDQASNDLRRDLNAFAKSACHEGAETDAVGHYNSLIDALISDYEERKAENEERRDFEKASINATMLGKLSLAKISELPPECDDPILPGR